MEGIHIRAFAQTLVDDPAIGALTIQIAPIPSAVIEELGDHLRRAALAWFTEKKIANGTMVEVPIIPPGSLPN